MSNEPSECPDTTESPATYPGVVIIAPRMGAALILAVGVAGMVVGGYFGLLAGDGYYQLEHHHARDIQKRLAAKLPGYAIMWPPVWPRVNPTEIRKAYERLGLRTGVVVGLIAAMLWCRQMFRFAKRSRRLIAHGTWVGLVVGVLATLILHVVLMVATGSVFAQALIEGLIDAIISGSLTGALCGLLFWIVMRRTTPAEQDRQETSP